MKLRKMRLKPKSVNPSLDDESWTNNPKWRVILSSAPKYLGVRLFVFSITRAK